MTDRINALIVVLDHDYRDDDVQVIVQAIRMIRGVSNVQANVADFDDLIAQDRAKSELRSKILDLLRQ